MTTDIHLHLSHLHSKNRPTPSTCLFCQHPQNETCVSQDGKSWKLNTWLEEEDLKKLFPLPVSYSVTVDNIKILPIRQPNVLVVWHCCLKSLKSPYSKKVSCLGCKCLRAHQKSHIYIIMEIIKKGKSFRTILKTQEFKLYSEQNTAVSASHGYTNKECIRLCCKKTGSVPV